MTPRPFPSTAAPHSRDSRAIPARPASAPDAGVFCFGEGEDGFVTLRAKRMLRQGKLSLAQLADAEAAPDPEVTAVIPARNEAATIASVVRECLHYAAHVIVVEGGSTDRTAEVAAAAGAQVVRDRGLGKGAALRLAVEHVVTPICVFVDADGSHDPIDIPLLVVPIKAGLADHVTGSRQLGGSDELHGSGDEFLRLAGSAFITALLNWRYGTRLSDSQNGFRAIRTDVFRRLGLRSRHTTIEMEMISATLAAGWRIAEVPTHERRRAAGYSKISLSSPAIWLAYGWQLFTALCRRRAAPRPPA
ncbi:MAG TPA: glycosyltransferase family 2 protein [Opitutaceae bacterium]|nr:glycosyltransferase family 2 protein [Opitutaceae bacterium]